MGLAAHGAGCALAEAEVGQCPASPEEHGNLGLSGAGERGQQRAESSPHAHMEQVLEVGPGQPRGQAHSGISRDPPTSPLPWAPSPQPLLWAPRGCRWQGSLRPSPAPLGTRVC